MRATRIIYVENDPALREILSKLLAREDGIEVIAAVGSATEALKIENLAQIDAALIDYSLGADSLNGLELGIALRAFNEHLGIIIYSQFDVANFASRIPSSMKHGWGFATKSGSAEISELAAKLQNVALGRNLPIEAGKSEKVVDERINKYLKLTERQRATMQLASQGFNPKSIGDQLGMSYDVARQELSRSYKILVPDLMDEQVLSIRAIIEFNALREALGQSNE